jgi:hypothetical protein
VERDRDLVVARAAVVIERLVEDPAPELAQLIGLGAVEGDVVQGDRHAHSFS